ncbi:MAG: hypothetical protein U1C70_10685 [Sediminibacterium sp.]|jgi:hypothetical protein|uniref:hypothetical protein n=1 Tax=Sediminibacterium sp. TaxID=1917865 RepID=UPI002AB8BF2C|nr:hypothetical protein [Sediminibacterium sp.]MDZ4072282.1 hypothetical protein [Sediminibacterium sp.]
MRKEKLLIIFFILGFLLSMSGAIMKIMHFDESPLILMGGLISIAAFIFMSLSEILPSDRIGGNEKFMWVIGFLFMNILAGILYFIYRRKRIITPTDK